MRDHSGRPGAGRVWSTASSPEGETIPEPMYDGKPIDDQWEDRYFDQWLVLAKDLGGGWFPTNLRPARASLPAICYVVVSKISGEGQYLGDRGAGALTGLQGAHLLERAVRDARAECLLPLWREGRRVGRPVGSATREGES